VRVARPAVRDLRPAAINLAKATPDLVASFHELNRFFNMAAYNPRGREPVTGNAAADRNRDEGYLFWLAWVSQNTTSLFSTSDAQGPLRRFTIFFTCTTIRSQLAAQPAGGPLLGLSNALNDPGLCNNGEGGNTGSGLFGTPNPKQKGGKQTSPPAGGTPTTPDNSGPLPEIPSIPNPTDVGVPNPTGGGTPTTPSTPPTPDTPVPPIPGLPYLKGGIR
jgi:hypothetical protein